MYIMIYHISGQNRQFQVMLSGNEA